MGHTFCIGRNVAPNATLHPHTNCMGHTFLYCASQSSTNKYTNSSWRFCSNSFLEGCTSLSSTSSEWRWCCLCVADTQPSHSQTSLVFFFFGQIGPSAIMSSLTVATGLVRRHARLNAKLAGIIPLASTPTPTPTAAAAAAIFPRRGLTQLTSSLSAPRYCLNAGFNQHRSCSAWAVCLVSGGKSMVVRLPQMEWTGVPNTPWRSRVRASVDAIVSVRIILHGCSALAVCLCWRVDRLDQPPQMNMAPIKRQEKNTTCLS